MGYFTTEIDEILDELQTTDKALERLLGRLEPQNNVARANYNELADCHNRLRSLTEDITSCLIEIE